MKLRIALASGAAFVACIFAANYVTSRYGMVPVGFGITATAGTYLAGITFVLRDTVQDALGKSWTLGLIIIGAALSFLLAVTYFAADPTHLPPGVTPARIALASGVAFLASETADLLVYTPLRGRGYIRAAVASNVVGALVDTLLFLWIAGFPVAAAFAGQIVGKIAVTLAVVLAIAVARTGRRRAA